MSSEFSRRQLLKYASVSSVGLLLPPAMARRSGATGATRLLSLEGMWQLAHDPQDLGLAQKWFRSPTGTAKAARVPGIAQSVLPGVDGVFWYWKDFDAPELSSSAGGAWLQLWGVDYAATVWINDTLVGRHEGCEIPFRVDVSSALNANGSNRCAIRLVNPGLGRVDGLVLGEIPKGAKAVPYYAGGSWNTGGITDSIELVAATGGVAIDDVWVRPDPRTGRISLTVAVQNARPDAAEATLSVAAGRAGHHATSTSRSDVRLVPGDAALEAAVTIAHPRLWDLEHPTLYEVAVQLRGSSGEILDARTVRCGFRDFRVQGGYFRLNGRRLFLKSAHTVNDRPHGLSPREDRELLRKDLLHLKSMGFDMVRFIWGGATRDQLDLCDEIGLLVYRETRAAWPMADSPQLEQRFDDTVSGVIRRDRNHPSVAIWGLLNETPDGRVFRHAVGMLDLVRDLDDSRVVMLASGRWDAQPGIGSLANPGSRQWDFELGDEHAGAPPSAAGVGDVHFYGRVPHTPDVIRFLRTVGRGLRHGTFLSEYGIGSAVDLDDDVREYRRRGIEDLDDGRFYADRLDRFLADHERWRLGDMFPTPRSFFSASLAKMAGQRHLGLTAVRSNPNLVGHNLTGAVDQVMCGEGLATTFRKLKPGAAEAVRAEFASLRWCLFAEPGAQLRGVPIRLEAVLVNEDVLAPRTYRARLAVIGPDGRHVLRRTAEIRVEAGAEPPFARPVHAEDVTIDGPPGRYRFTAALAHRGGSTTAEIEFVVDDPAGMPAIDTDVLFWGDAAPEPWHDIATYTAGGYRGQPEWHDGNGGYVWPSRMHPAPGNEAARTWIAPRDGTVDITGSVAKWSVAVTGNGVVVRIEHGDELAWGPTTIGAADTTGVEANVSGLAVRAGDPIRFVIANNGDWGDDATAWDPTIAYRGGGPSFTASEGFSSVQGANGWRYQDADPDAQLVRFLEARGARVRRLEGDPGGAPLPIVCGSRPPAGDPATRFAELARWVRAGSTAVFLSHGVFGGDPLAWAAYPADWHDIATYRTAGYEGLREWHDDAPTGGYVWPGAQHPGPANETARAWTAPRDGTVDISSHAAKGDLGGNGVVVRIVHEDETVWGPVTIGGFDAAGVDANVAGLAIRAGDVIRFVIANNGDWGADQTQWDPTITYRDDGTAFTASDGFSGTQGANGWRYQDAGGRAGFADIYGWLYLKDEWAREHPIFAGLQSGGLMDYAVYAPVIGDTVMVGLPEHGLVAVAGAIKASQDYASGLMVAAYPLGSGGFVLNTLAILENLHTPVGERLLRNLVCFAAKESA